MTKNWTIKVTTESGETFSGAMTRQEPSLVNGFIAVATEDGDWIYLKPDTVTKMHFTPVAEEATEETDNG